MACILAVAEKPSVAKELTAIIAKQPPERLRRAGFSQYNHIFDIDHCLFKGEPARMRMTSVLGHMMELEFDANYRSWSACAPGDLFGAPVRKEVKKEATDLQRTLVAEAKKCNILMLWLDCDLEGENISYEVIKVCLEANPRLDVYRARFSALIERDILRTMRHPERPNPHMNDAVDARQEIDLRIGAAFTRFQTKRLQKKFDDLSKSVVSYGPCQFPTLGFVVDRDLHIKNFEAEDFWHITCDGEFDNPDKLGTKMMCSFNWDRFRVYDRLAAVLLYESCLEDHCIAKVIKRIEKPTSKRKPVPLNTIEFQILASRYLRMGSERAMAVAEALYHRGILSYPRTETNFFKEGFELMPLLVDQKAHSLWGQQAAQLVDENKFEWPRHGGKDDQAHPPIHPTKCVELTSLETDEERNVYELVSRHFIACCWKDAKGSQTTISIAIPEGGETFSANGLMVLERNYLEVYSKYEFWNAVKVPTLAIGDTFVPKKLMLVDGKTCPPDPLSEADLISLMDKNGIGTDATIASHISTIQSREYATKDNRNRFIPTNLGLALVEGYNSMGYQLNKPQLRAAIEADCQRVARGEMQKEDAIAKSINLMKNCFENCVKEVHKLDRAMEKYFTSLGAGPANRYDIIHRNLSTCGKCHEGMELRVERAAAVPGRDKNRFLFCRHCKCAYNLPPRGELQQHEISCSICGFQALTVTNLETNKEHTLCPFCYSNPPPPPDGLESVDDFRCFSCAKENCALAMRIPGSELNIAPCSERNCNGHFRLKRNSKGYICSCTNANCKSIWWLPKAIKTVIPQAGNICLRCQQRDGTSILKLLIKFNLATAPPGTPPEATVCPSCDQVWDTIGQAKLPRKAGNAAPQVSNNRSMASFTASASMYQPIIHLDQAPPIPQAYNNLSAYVPPTSYVQQPQQQQQQYPNPYTSSSSNRFPPMQEEASFSFVSHHSNPPRANSSVASSNSSHNIINLEDMGNDDTQSCGCGVPCKLLTVNKEGPNKGRKFYSCPKPRDAGCQFFQWADEPARVNNRFAGSSSSSSSSALPPIRPSANQQSNANFPNCNCGEKAVCLTTLKEGPNKDRQFYCCSKRRDDSSRCEFFQWTDQPPTNNTGRGQRTFQAAAGSDVVCSICKEYGHYARQCPNK